MLGFFQSSRPRTLWAEAYLGLLPRAWMNWAEVHRVPRGFFTVPGPEPLRHLWQGVRIALVKQDLYPDLYCCPPALTPAETIRTSLRRTGPMGFLMDLGASFFMVHEEWSAPECRAWEESIGSNPQTREADLKLARAAVHEVPLEANHGHSRPPFRMATSASDVDWEVFDMVVSMDIAIPRILMGRFPKTLWVYFPADPGTPTAKRALRWPPDGFDVALTHTHRRFPARPFLGRNTVECPYSFQSSFSWDQVWPASGNRRGVMVEHQTFGLLTPAEIKLLEAFGPVRHPSGSVDEVADSLRSSKYYLRLQGGPLSGNGQVEAVMAGCLALGNPETFVQRSLFTPSTVVRSLSTALEKIRFWEQHANHYESTRAEQLAIAEFVCFRRPAWQLWNFLKRKKAYL